MIRNIDIYSDESIAIIGYIPLHFSCVSCARVLVCSCVNFLVWPSFHSDCGRNPTPWMALSKLVFVVLVPFNSDPRLNGFGSKLGVDELDVEANWNCSSVCCGHIGANRHTIVAELPRILTLVSKKFNLGGGYMQPTPANQLHIIPGRLLPGFPLSKFGEPALPIALSYPNAQFFISSLKR